MNQDELTKIVANTVRFERIVPWAYCDDRGYVTVAVGNLVRDRAAMGALPFKNVDLSDASSEAKSQAFTTVLDAFRPNLYAGAYADKTSIRLPIPYCIELCQKRLITEFIPVAVKLFHDWDKWPADARAVVVDMLYNGGVHFLSGYPTFTRAMQEGRFADAAEECLRSEPGATADTCKKPRNKWAVMQLRRVQWLVES